MGHIELAAPVSHIWYFKGIPSRISLMLDISPKALEQVLYFASYIVIDPGEAREISKMQILTETEYRDLYEKYEDDFRAGMGAEAIKELLTEIDLDQLYTQITTDLEGASGQKRVRLLKRLEVVESFRQSGNRPEWMILDVIPVIPPTSDLWFSLMVVDLQHLTLMTYIEELLTETTVLQDYLNYKLLILLSETKRECYRKLLTH